MLPRVHVVLRSMLCVLGLWERFHDSEVKTQAGFVWLLSAWLNGVLSHLICCAGVALLLPLQRQNTLQPGNQSRGACNTSPGRQCPQSTVLLL